MPATTTVGEALKAGLASHHAKYSPVYGGYLSDHGPMAALALAGLGCETDRALRWLERYRQRLEPLAAAPPGYRARLAILLDEIARLGPGAVLEQQLPALISGWAKQAYHPLIRTAYGYTFGIPEEVAAGLAYLAWSGAEPAIAEAARHPRAAEHVDAPLAAMKACATKVAPGRRFDDCLAQVCRATAFRRVAVMIDDPLRAYSGRALSVFAATHDFFALHLVTGAHAFRLLYDFAGPDRDAIFALGVLAGYASVGAPDYPVPADGVSTSRPDAAWLDLVGDDDHRIKLTFSAQSQWEWSGNPAYAETAFAYLNRR